MPRWYVLGTGGSRGDPVDAGGRRGGQVAVREEGARRRVTEERLRIARELHDVVAHHITLVNAQAGVVHHLMRTDPEHAYQALERIRDTSRAALDELRATVGLLRSSDAPALPREPAPASPTLTLCWTPSATPASTSHSNAPGNRASCCRSPTWRPAPTAHDLHHHSIERLRGHAQGESPRWSASRCLALGHSRGGFIER
ncbi:histidine kinase dimerization/phosphoacceptor domain-containing protein [Streptomyces sp. NPDC054933]